jgi:dsDNA-binding SOS-regulon protein
MAVSGKLSLEDLDIRARDQMKRVSKLDSRSRKLMMEQIQRSMPDLAEQVSENINAEQQMVLAGRGVQELRNSGMSVHSAMESFFGGDKQAIKAFTEYAKNLPSILQEQKRQNYLAEQDKLLARSSQAIDYSQLNSNNMFTNFFKATADSYDQLVTFAFNPEERARQALLREEKAKYRNLGFANGINDNSILSNILRNQGVTRNPYTLNAV